ncbi:YidC/Oxa1 family membrane protein insertase [Clostridium beijerinckii]|uniref:YidC/Oxa1 family membrane protein insertase n=1 Tax=Clostridium beijerinckii TaxID=1520 RepID=UPI0014948806|nr:YidC/Oxa1 family membrane protein insertase [Clostridium beijerinckii]NOW05309.1 YidC/Oxa1 family membrane protein insertase [Clostridium beijerinckii]NRT72990.1 YidC/Oxa1 family membrane protein insertase [Clostridium beijerinckii]NYC01549.1 YidC/Oxa1 family membrane protein insertase [Clostridium beijerinckii]
MNIISNLLNVSLNYFFNITGDLGIAIILLTILVKLILMPISFKQKLSMYSQQEFSNGLEEIKEKYKSNKEKLEIETQKYFKQNAKGMIGILSSLLQIPIVFTLYNVILNMPMQVGTALIPWVVSLKMSDSLFIVPAIYAFSMISPNLLPYIPFLRLKAQVKLSKTNIIITTIISGLVTFKAPIALGIYFITTSLFSFVEEVAFRLYAKRRGLAV